jgi:hypothetical protein
MNKLLYVVISLILLLSNLASSEISFDLIGKIEKSDIIVVADVSEFELGNINEEGQLTKIKFKTEKVLKGSIDIEFLLLPRSVSYQIGNTAYGSTVGWSNAHSRVRILI